MKSNLNDLKPNQSKNDNKTSIINKVSNNLKLKRNPIKTKEIKVYLSRQIRLLIFFLFILKEILVDIDAGIVAATSLQIKKTLLVNDSQYGFFASIPFTGRLIGAFIFIILFNNDHRKFWLVISSIIHGCLLSVYCLTKNYFILLLIRMFTAIIKSFSTIYLPIWIDQFGIRRYKTILLTILHMTNPYGNVIGFSLGSLIFSDWRKGFLYTGICIAITGMLFIFFPQKYFSNKYMFIGYEEEVLVPTKKDVKTTNKKNYNQRKESVFSDADMSLISENNQNNSGNKGTCNNALNLAKNKAFMFSSFSRSVIFFVLQIIHLYFKEYSISVLKVSNENKIVLYYSFITITAPALGSLIGGAFSNYLGGYESPNSIVIVIIFNLLAGFAVIFLSLTKNYIVFSMSVFLFFYSVSGILPTITGYTLLSSPKLLKSLSSSVDLLITTLFGKLPGPIIYGTLCDYFGDTGNSIAWKFSMLYYYVGSITLFISCKFIKQKMLLLKTEDIHKNRGFAKTFEKDTIHLSEVGCGDRVSLIKIGKPEPRNNINRND